MSNIDFVAQNYLIILRENHTRRKFQRLRTDHTTITEGCCIRLLAPIASAVSGCIRSD